MQIVSFALEERMFFDMEDDVEVTGRASEGTGFAQATEADASAVFDSRGHLGFDHALTQQAGFAFALGARVGDDAAGTLASWAGAGDAEKALLVADLPAAIAGTAGDWCFAGRGSGTATVVAGFVATNLDLLFSAEDCFLKFEVQVFAEIGSALRTTAAPTRSSEQVAEAEELAEDVAEILEDCGIEAGAGGTAAHPGMAETVIKRTLFAVGQNRIGFRNLFELLFGIRIVRVAVGMIRHRELAIGALDLDLSRRARNAEDFVIITFCVGGQKIPLNLG